MSNRTLDPFYMDTNIVSSVDLLQKVSSYIDLLSEFTDEAALNSMYWHTGSHSDPTTSRLTIFKELNAGTLNIKSSSNGVNQSKFDSTKIKNKNFRDQLPDTVHLKTSDASLEGEPDMASDLEVNAEHRTRGKTWVTDDEKIGTSSTGRWFTTSGSTPITRAVEPLPESHEDSLEFSAEFGMKDMSPWFIMWWLDKFYTAHANIKADLKAALGEDNEYFVDFSESVGQLKNLEVYSDTSTAPIWDYEIKVFGDDPPNIIPGTAGYNTARETVDLTTTLSLKTNQLFRANMRNLMEDPSADEVITGPMPSFPQMSHGNNLVDDANHTFRMYGAIEGVLEAIEDHLKGLYPVLEMFTDKQNKQVSGKPLVIDLKVEDRTVGVDLLKNKIRKFSEKLNQTSAMFGKATKYGNALTTNEYLRSRPS